MFLIRITPEDAALVQRVAKDEAIVIARVPFDEYYKLVDSDEKQRLTTWLKGIE